MKDIFDFKRFGKYFVTEIKGCIANYGLSIITISLLLYIISYVMLVSVSLITTSEWTGLGLGFRATLFITSLFSLVVTMPVKCYGKITEKQAGSAFLTLPVSRLEKYVSMLLMTVIIAPVTCIVLFLGLDTLICNIDKTCGSPLLTEISNLSSLIINLPKEIAYESAIGEITAEVAKFIKQMTNPWLYVDDIIGINLVFLLGAVWFKTGKTVKTMMAWTIFAIITSIVFTPLIEPWSKELLNATTAGDFEAIFQLSIFRHAALIDTVNDTIVNIALFTAIWFRIKTLKH